MIEIVNVQARNIGSYKELDVKLNNRGIVLLTGKNGAGKSTLVDIVQLGLYGRSARYSSYKDLLKKGEPEGEIVIRFRVNGEEYILTRSVMPGHQKLKLTDFNGSDITGIHLEATQEKLETRLKTHWNTFSNIVTVSGEPILFSETDGYQKSFMERMLGFEVYSEALEISRNYRKAVETELSELKLDISEKTVKQQTLKVQIQSLNEKDQEVKKVKLLEAKMQLDGLNADIAGDQGEIENLLFFEKRDSDILKELVDSNVGFVSIMENILNEKNRLAKEVLRLQDEISANQTIIDLKVCPTCKQEVKTEEVQEALEYLEALEISLGSITMKLNGLVIDYSNGMKEVNKYESRKTELENCIRTHQSNLSSLRAHQRGLHKRVESMERRIAEIEQETGPETTSMVSDLSKVELELQTLSGKLLDVQASLESLEFCVEAFGDKGIKSLLIEQYLMDISESMNQNLEFLTDGKMSAFLVPVKRLKSQEFRDKMTLKVVDRDTGEELLDYPHCSEGQRACVNISALLAFHDIISAEKGVKWNILFLDEVLESLDPDRIKNMTRLLAKKVSEFPSILLTTHRPEFGEAFENVWTVLKKDGTSVLEE